MTESWTGFRITLDYSERELALYRRSRRRQQGRPWLVQFLAMVGTGFVSASLAVALAEAAGAVRYGGGATIAALGFAVFWLGCWTPAMWLSLLTRRETRRRLEIWQARWNGARLWAGPAGIAIRMADERFAVAWSAITAATEVSSLVVLRTSLGGEVLVPARLLQPAQRARLLSRGAAAVV